MWEVLHWRDPYLPWSDPEPDPPDKCPVCGEGKFEYVGCHSWEDATTSYTCEAFRCDNCNATLGNTVSRLNSAGWRLEHAD